MPESAPTSLTLIHEVSLVERDGQLQTVCPCSGFYLCGHCVHDVCFDCDECAGPGCVCACMREERAVRAQGVRIYLTTHMVNWLATSEIPLMVNRGRLAPRKSFPRARSAWVLDSGGFTMLQRNGRWTLSAAEYAAEVRQYAEAIGRMEWAAPQDWMCEPWVIYGGTHQRLHYHGTRAARGLTDDDPEQDLDTAVTLHQQYTVANFLELRSIAPDLPFIPVLQGWELRHYLDCAQIYADAGVDLAAAPVVGLGSVCRRQATAEIREIVEAFAARGVRLHGFGVKIKGLAAYARHLTSVDSMAWSKDARYSPPLAGHSHKNCANCPDWAFRWHARITDAAAARAPQLGGDERGRSACA
ncbi:deazapurine DNA modification protein DpdA family protein [Streptomyces aculeolatus]